jgi:hypothetical protein
VEGFQMEAKKFNIIKTDNYIRIEKLNKAHVMSKELSYNEIADYSFIKKEGCVCQYSGVVPKVYKTYTGWKKAVKRLFDIDVEE